MHPMVRQVIHFASLLFTALAMVPSLAHLIALPNKIGLPRDQYFVVQQIYSGWALAGVVVGGALLSTLALGIDARRQQPAFAWAVSSLLCIVGTQIVFWLFTFPTNQATNDWTRLPEQWAALRRQWEYSHAASAILNLAAFIAVTCSVLSIRNWQGSRVIRGAVTVGRASELPLSGLESARFRE
jgi:hypothetical protein